MLVTYFLDGDNDGLAVSYAQVKFDYLSSVNNFFKVSLLMRFGEHL